MAILIESHAVEFGRRQVIELCCKYCGVSYADICYVKSFDKNFWRVDESSMNWEAIYLVVEGLVICECSIQLGKKIENNILLFSKRDCKLMH